VSPTDPPAGAAPQLVYFANPMCSWCWGFAPVLRQVQEGFGDAVALSVALGALERGDRPLDAAARERLKAVWARVAAQTGQRFETAALELPTLAYDTMPPCRAVAVVRAAYPAQALAFLSRLQERYYVLGEDPRDPAMLAATAGEFGLGAAAFRAGFAAPATAELVAAEWAQTAALGVQGYPTLLALGRGRPRLVTAGWRPAAEIATALADWLAEPARPA
jgi:putative protein-disulfide isomerase